MNSVTTSAPKTAKESYALNYWRLFHCFLRHTREDDELRRTKATWSWMMDNVLSLRKACVDIQLDLLQIVWSCALEDQDLPGYDLVLEKVRGAEKNDALLDALKEYRDFEPNLKVHAPEDLPSVFRDLATDWERERITNLLKLTNRITNSTLEEKKIKWAGPRDAIHYLMKGLESGLLISETETTHPINVKNEAEGTLEYYEEMKRRGFIPTGFPQFDVQLGNFMGILGYAGDGKSTTLRYLIYSMAAAGKQCIHITLENDAAVERNKFVLMHAHNPKFQGEFAALTYKKFKTGTLSLAEKNMLREVAKDFKATIDGNITIHQPLVASWPACKTFIEMQDLVSKVDVCGIDYLQMIDPPTSRSEDQKSRMTAMVKDVRQYGLTFGGNRKLFIATPIQSNEEGLKKAQDADGVWTLSGINMDKELARSCDFIMGVFSKGRTKTDMYGEVGSMVGSCVKERDGVGFSPFSIQLTGAGWMLPMAGGPSAVPIEEIPSDMYDDLPNLSD